MEIIFEKSYNTIKIENKKIFIVMDVFLKEEDKTCLIGGIGEIKDNEDGEIEEWIGVDYLFIPFNDFFEFSEEKKKKVLESIIEALKNKYNSKVHDFCINYDHYEIYIVSKLK